MRYLTVIICLFYVILVEGQDPKRFQQEINTLLQAQIPPVDDRPLALFVGSSSIRIWNTLEKDIPEVRSINRGFGGSEMSDLLYYAPLLINSVSPDKIIIYEGDNDLANGENPSDIIDEAKSLVSLIRNQHPDAQIFFISAKPSISRWDLKEKYIDFNYKLSLYSLITPNIYFIDVWSALCDQEGEVMKDIFMQDQLHLNPKGYQLWSEAIQRELID